MPGGDDKATDTLPGPTRTVEAVLGWRLGPTAHGTLNLLTADGTECDLVVPDRLLARLALAAVSVFTEWQQHETPEGLRLHHPVSNWAVEPMPDEPEQCLLTLATVDSFTLTFLLDRAELAGIARAATPAAPSSKAKH